MRDGLLHIFFHELTLAKNIIEQYSNQIIKFSQSESDKENVQEIIKYLHYYSPLNNYIKKEGTTKIEEDFDKNNIITIHKETDIITVTIEDIQEIIYYINFLKYYFIRNCLKTLLLIAKRPTLMQEILGSFISYIDNLSINQEILQLSSALLPQIKKDEFFYGLRLLSDYDLRQFLTIMGVFEDLYSLISNNNKTDFIKKIKEISFENNWLFLLFLLKNDEIGIEISKLYKTDQSFFIDLTHFFSKPIFIFFDNFEKYTNSFFEDYYSKNFNDKQNFVLNQLESFHNILNALPNFYNLIYTLIDCPIYLKEELKEDIQNFASIFKIEIVSNNYPKIDWIDLSKIMLPKLYGIVIKKIKTLQNKETDHSSVTAQLIRFTKDNFSISLGYETKVDYYLNQLSKWMDTIKDTKNFYALVYLFYPRFKKQGKGGDEFKLMDHRLNEKRMVWRNEPQTQEEVVDLILKYFPQFREYKDEKSWSAGAGKQREALEQLKKKPELSWIGEWQKEIWNPEVLKNMEKKG